MAAAGGSWKRGTFVAAKQDDGGGSVFAGQEAAQQDYQRRQGRITTALESGTLNGRPLDARMRQWLERERQRIQAVQTKAGN